MIRHWVVPPKTSAPSRKTNVSGTGSRDEIFFWKVYEIEIEPVPNVNATHVLIMFDCLVEEKKNILLVSISYLWA
jgi:hypothetical protein